MKNKKFAGKLAFNKETVSSLVINEMEQVNGGVDTTIFVTNNYNTCSPSWCGLQCF